jgi:hypothetical protein
MAFLQGLWHIVFSPVGCKRAVVLNEERGDSFASASGMKEDIYMVDLLINVDSSNTS